MKKWKEREREREKGRGEEKRERKPRHLWNNQINRIESIETFKMNYIFLINEKLANSAVQQITPPHRSPFSIFFPPTITPGPAPFCPPSPYFFDSSKKRKKHVASHDASKSREKKKKKKKEREAKSGGKNLGIIRNFPKISPSPSPASKSRLDRG